MLRYIWLSLLFALYFMLSGTSLMSGLLRSSSTALADYSSNVFNRAGMPNYKNMSMGMRIKIDVPGKASDALDLLGGPWGYALLAILTAAVLLVFAIPCQGAAGSALIAAVAIVLGFGCAMLVEYNSNVMLSGFEEWIWLGLAAAHLLAVLAVNLAWQRWRG